MNKKVELKKYRLLQKIKYSSRSGNKRGYVKIYPNNSYKHELVKFQIAYKLLSQGFEVYSEVEFNNGKRADLVAIDKKSGKGYIIEVLNSESNKRYELKLDSYPLEFEMIKVHVDKFNLDNFSI